VEVWGRVGRVDVGRSESVVRVSHWTPRPNQSRHSPSPRRDGIRRVTLYQCGIEHARQTDFSRLLPQRHQLQFMLIRTLSQAWIGLCDDSPRRMIHGRYCSRGQLWISSSSQSSDLLIAELHSNRILQTMSNIRSLHTVSSRAVCVMILDLDIGHGSMNVGSSNKVPRSCAKLGASKLSAAPGANIAPSSHLCTTSLPRFRIQKTPTGYTVHASAEFGKVPRTATIA